MPHLSIRDRFNQLADRARPFGLTPVFQVKHKTTNGSYIHDRIALHKTLLLCTGCRRKTWPKRFNYIELTMYHAEGICDGCQVDGPAALWMWEGSEVWAEHARAGKFEAVRRREITMGQRLN